MRAIQKSLVIANVMACLISSHLCFGADFSAYFNKLPLDTNSVVVIQVAELLNSPRGKAENWNERSREQFLSGAISIPPTVDVLVSGSLVRPQRREEDWTRTVCSVPSGPTMQQVAQFEQTSLQTISGKPALMSHRGAYLVELEAGVIGAVRPPYRQDVANWIESVEAGTTGPRSEYLRQVVGSTAHVLMAIDMRHTLDPDVIRARLNELEDFQGKRGVVDDLTELIASLRGVRLEVVVGETSEGIITVDFDRATRDSGMYVKTVLVRALEDFGFYLPELNNVEVKVEENSVALSSSFSDESMRRVLSLVMAPAVSGAREDSGNVDSGETRTDAPARSNAKVSQDYLASVNQLIDDLIRANNRATNMSNIAGWHDSYAKKIRNLSPRGVDPDLVRYAMQVSNSLSAVAASLRGQAVQVMTEQGTLVYDVDYDPAQYNIDWWGGFGYYPGRVDVRSNLADVRRKQADAINAGAGDRAKIWESIRESRLAIEQEMREKYGNDFVTKP